MQFTFKSTRFYIKQQKIINSSDECKYSDMNITVDNKTYQKLEEKSYDSEVIIVKYVNVSGHNYLYYCYC